MRPYCSLASALRQHAAERTDSPGPAPLTVCLFRPDLPKAEEPPTVGGVQLATVQVRQAAPTVIVAQQPAPVVLAPAQPQVIYAPQPPPVSGQVIYTQ